MWPFRKKIVIKETRKVQLYGKHHQTNDYSVWDNMSIIEKFAMIVLPCMMCFMFYIMLEMTGLIWWLRLIIAIGIEILLIFVIWFLVTWFGGYE